MVSRSNLTKFLSVIVEQVVFCRLTTLQSDLYKLFTKSNNIDDLGKDGKISTSTLSAITQLKKLCNRK
jgi:DNA repair and recombination RAD54-like protein